MRELYHAARMRLLRFLLDIALPPRESEALVRDRTFDHLSALLEPLTQEDGMVSLFRYEDPLVEACIREAKFEGNMRAAQLLGHALHTYVYELAAYDTPIFIPLPLSKKRLAERGYNQVERVLRQVGIEMDTSLLVRTRDTLPQTTLSCAERRRNVVGAFAATRPCDTHRTYIVVDDVTTTGSTLHAACGAVRAAGARHLVPLALARATLAQSG